MSTPRLGPYGASSAQTNSPFLCSQNALFTSRKEERRHWIACPLDPNSTRLTLATSNSFTKARLRNRFSLVPGLNEMPFLFLPPRNIFATLVRRDRFRTIWLSSPSWEACGLRSDAWAKKRWWLNVLARNKRDGPQGNCSCASRGQPRLDWIGVKRAVGQSNCGQRRLLPAYVAVFLLLLAATADVRVVRPSVRSEAWGPFSFINGPSQPAFARYGKKLQVYTHELRSPSPAKQRLICNARQLFLSLLLFSAEPN
jgi:hypothetical protein